MSSNWVSKNAYLSTAEQQNNAGIIYTYLKARSWTTNAIAGMLGNMQRESTINPGIWQNLTIATANGYGLVQWTPSTNYTNWATAHGYAIGDGTGQLLWIDTETVSQGQWIQTSRYPITFAQFKASSMTAEECASAFMLNFERAGVAAEDERRTNARTWYNYLVATYDFKQRTTTPTADNLYFVNTDYGGYNSYQARQSDGLVLPNCTGYSNGRFSEIIGDGACHLNNLGNAENWFPNSPYPTSQDPALGAVICWENEAYGHVGVVEYIYNDGTGRFITSESDYSGSKFVRRTRNVNSLDFTYKSLNYKFQGFILNPATEGGGGDPGTTGKFHVWQMFKMVEDQRRFLK